MGHNTIWNTLAITALVGLAACDQGEPDRPVGPPLPGTGGTFEVGPGPAGGGAGVAGSFDCAAVAGGIPIPATPGFMGGGVSPRFADPVLKADKAPPPISGGTLLATADGQTLIAADPDRDAIYVIDVATRTLARRIALSPADEPGRVVQDKAGTVHVALRGGRGIASFGLAADAPLRRTEVCDAPRGMAYDAAADRLYLACAEGALVQIDPNAGTAIKQVQLGRDLRDVIVRGAQLFVTRFRSAELLAVDMNDGRVMATRKPATLMQSESVFIEDAPPPPNTNSGCFGFGGGHVEERMNPFNSEVAWRTIDVPGRGLAMLHQRAGGAEVRTSPGGYGGGGQACAPGVVHGAISLGDDAAQSVELSQAGLFVDLAVDPTGALLAVANPGGSGTAMGVMVFETPSVAQSTPPVPGQVPCYGPRTTVAVEGQPIAVSFVSPWMLAVQEREPAAISFYDVRTNGGVQRLDLKQPSRYDSGHTLFHLTTSSGLACASCHAEAGDDSHVWTFQGIGPRRTQNLRGGILGSEPFHWNGDMKDFGMLVNEVFNGRMGAPGATPDQGDALARWIDRQPALHATVADTAAAARGKTLFESSAAGCTTCHAGAQFRKNDSADVGTGALLQVPSLRGVSFRAPFMHDGCAPTLAERFGSCGGGDKHGHTSDLAANQIGDLVAYLESL